MRGAILAGRPKANSGSSSQPGSPRRTRTARVSPDFRLLVSKAAALRDTEIDAYIDPYLRRFISQMEQKLKEGGLPAMKGIGGPGVGNEATTINLKPDLPPILAQLAGAAQINVAALLNDASLRDAILADYFQALTEELAKLGWKVVKAQSQR